MTQTQAIAASARPNVDKSSDRVRDMFAQIAGKYDLMNHLLSLNIDRYWRSTTVRRVPIAVDARSSSGAPILDLCTGTGDLALAFAKKYPNIPIVGADFCHEMLEVARRKKTAGRHGLVEFIEASAMALPFESNHFQVVSIAFGIRNVENTDQGLAEVFRVCQPGGTVAILEFSQPTMWPLKSVYHWYFRSVLPRIGQWMARNDRSAYEYLPSSVSEFPFGKAFADRMANVGLVDVTFTPLTLGIATLYLGRKP